MSETPIDAKRWNWKPKLRWFAAEIAVVVAGVLIALALNAWWQGRQDAASEEHYLALISRDLGAIATNLEEAYAYEADQTKGGLEAYHIISANGRSPEQLARISDLLQRLTWRRTLTAIDATYTDLINTGNLPLIRNQVLRDQIISYFEKVEREFEINDKNNSFFVDDMFAMFINGSGLFYYRGVSSTSAVQIGGVDSLLTDSFRGGYADEPDPIWNLPYESPEWVRVKALLSARISISLNASSLAEALLEETRTLKDAVEAELAR